MKPLIRLSELPVNAEAVVAEVNCADRLRDRVMNMGIVKDAQIRPVFTAPFGDPVAYAVKNTMIALRRRDSRDIMVRYRDE